MARSLLAFAALLLCAAAGAAEGSCVVKNTSSKPVVLVPVVKAAAEVVVDVGATVVLHDAKQHYCYVHNKHTGHRKGPVKLSDGGIYAIVDANTVGQVNLSVAALLGGILDIGIIILGGI